MTVGSLLRGWAGKFILAAVWIAIAVVSSSPSSRSLIPHWVALLAAALYAGMSIYDLWKFPAGRPRKEAREREDPDLTQLLVFGLLAFTSLYSFWIIFQLLPVLHGMQR